MLVLFAITAAAAVPAFLADANTTPEQQTARALVNALMRTRESARESGAPATLVVSPSDGRYWLTTQDSSTTGVLPLAGGVTLISTTTDRIECRFQPAGPATPLAMTVQGVSGVTVHVDRWSGEIDIADAHRR